MSAPAAERLGDRDPLVVLNQLVRWLRERTEAAGQRLLERLPVYPTHLKRPEFFEASMHARALGFADADGYARPRPSLEAA